MASRAETAAMREAIALAARGLGATSPNPVVGCVVLDPTGVPVGRGWHERAGGPHAEVAALAEAGSRARGGTVVVTLEPCNHEGRTGPCVHALRAAGVRRVVVAVRDPCPPAAGGVEALRAGGVEVETGLLAARAARGNESWLTAVRLGRPFVTWKYAATLDGRVAAADGTSQWITSSQARVDAHRLRAQSDAIAVGVGTVLADDPHLTVRDRDGRLAARQPLRVVVDTSARAPRHARVFDGAAPTWWASAGTSAPPAGATPAGLPASLPQDPSGRGVDLRALLAALYQVGVRAVLVEGGPTLAGAFVAAGLVDRVVGYLAPALLGAGAAALGPSGIDTIVATARLRLSEATRVGPDLRVVARPQREER